MSEASSSLTSVLLPGARVVMFARDAESVMSFKALQDDWRFARVQAEHHEGGIEEATEALKNGTVSPDLLIIETDSIDDGFTDRLETLSGYCPEGTAAIVIGPVNDVNLYRKLIGMGISDYLVRPVKLETLSHDIAKTLIERLGASGSHLIAVMGAKGGVGATAIAQAMAWGAADMLGQKTVLIDAAGGWSTLSIGMNFEPATTLHEAVRAAVTQNDDSFNRMLFQAHERLHVLSSGGDVMLDETVDPTGYETLINKLMTTYPVVIVDLSNSPTILQRAVLNRAHQIALVTTPLLPSLRAARTLIQEIGQLRQDIDTSLNLVVSMAGISPKQEIPQKELEKALERAPAAIISYDPALFSGMESEGKKLNSTPEGALVARRLVDMISKILGGASGESASIANDDHDKKNPFSAIFSKLKQKA